MSDLLARLLSAGTPPELVAEVAMELARAEAAKEAISERRHRDRLRQSEKRARDNVMSRDTAEIHDVTDKPLSLSPNENNSNPHTHTPENTTPRARKGDFPKPDWADGEVWRDFMANRKAKRLPNTPTAYKRFNADIAQFSDAEWPPGRVLEYAVSRGWGAIFDPRNRNGSNGRTQQNRATGEPVNAMVRAVARRKAERAACGIPGDAIGSGGWPEDGASPAALPDRWD